MDLASCYSLTDGMTASLIAFIQSHASGAVVLQQEWMGLDEDEKGPMVWLKASRGIYSYTNTFSDYEYRHFDGKTIFTEDKEEPSSAAEPSSEAESSSAAPATSAAPASSAAAN